MTKAPWSRHSGHTLLEKNMNHKGSPHNTDPTAASDSSPLEVELHQLHCALVHHEALLVDVDEQLNPVKNVARVPQGVDSVGKGPSPDSALSPLGTTVREFTRRVERATHRLSELQTALEV